MEYYPNAKVILTVRDSNSWIKSWNVLNNQVLKSFTFRFLAFDSHKIILKQSMFTQPN